MRFERLVGICIHQCCHNWLKPFDRSMGLVEGFDCLKVPLAEHLETFVDCVTRSVGYATRLRSIRTSFRAPTGICGLSGYGFNNQGY